MDDGGGLGQCECCVICWKMLRFCTPVSRLLAVECTFPASAPWQCFPSHFCWRKGGSCSVEDYSGPSVLQLTVHRTYSSSSEGKWYVMLSESSQWTPNAEEL